jgi:hypothetical protein
MKKIMSTIVAALVAVSFAGIVFAEDVPNSDHQLTAPAEVRRAEAMPMEHHRHYRHHRHHRHHRTMMENAAPAVPMATPVPAPPVAQ